MADFLPTNAMGWADLGSSVISSVGSLFGGGGAAKTAAKWDRHTREMLFPYQIQQLEREQDLAYNGVTRRVTDAKNAGIHPLVAMGMSPASGGGSVSIGGGSSAPSEPHWLEKMGQGVGRAVNAVQTAGERAVTAKITEQQLERGDLENDLLRSQIARNLASQNPALPNPNSTKVIDLPLERINGAVSEPASVNSVGYMQGNDGTYSPVKSKDATERLEDDFIGNLLWSFKNRLLPAININKTPPYPAPKGKVWKYNSTLHHYKLYDERR